MLRSEHCGGPYHHILDSLSFFMLEKVPNEWIWCQSLFESVLTVKVFFIFAIADRRKPLELNSPRSMLKRFGPCRLVLVLINLSGDRDRSSSQGSVVSEIGSYWKLADSGGWMLPCQRIHQNQTTFLIKRRGINGVKGFFSTPDRIWQEFSLTQCGPFHQRRSPSKVSCNHPNPFKVNSFWDGRVE